VRSFPWPGRAAPETHAAAGATGADAEAAKWGFTAPKSMADLDPWYPPHHSLHHTNTIPLEVTHHWSGVMMDDDE
jgi:hypothetical protein